MPRRVATQRIELVGRRAPADLDELLPPLSDEEAAQYERDLRALDRAECEGEQILAYGRIICQACKCTVD